MDAIRYLVALLAVVLYPPALLYWIFVHPLARTWRRIGIKRSYMILLPFLVAIGLVIFHMKRVILSVDFGIKPALAAAAAVPVCAGILIEILCWRQLSLSVLLGLDEIGPEGSSGTLLTEGIYGRIRHPRYAGAGLLLLGFALFTNYLAVYLLFIFYLPAVYMISVLEERELIDRFGEQYLQYRKKVPAFIPLGFL